MSSNFGFRKIDYPKDKSLVIYGAGEFARIAKHYFETDAGIKVENFVIDDEFVVNSDDYMFQGKPVFSESHFLKNKNPEKYCYFVAYSARNLSFPRMRKVQQISSRGLECISYISSRSFVDLDSTFGNNVFVFENNTLQTEVDVGDGTVIWSGNHIGHQTKIGKANFISSHVCIGGRVNIGNNCYLGMNSTVRDMINMGDKTVLGANSFINNDFLGNGVLVGSPAKRVDGKDPLMVIK